MQCAMCVSICHTVLLCCNLHKYSTAHKSIDSLIHSIHIASHPHRSTPIQCTPLSMRHPYLCISCTPATTVAHSRTLLLVLSMSFLYAASTTQKSASLLHCLNPLRFCGAQRKVLFTGILCISFFFLFFSSSLLLSTLAILHSSFTPSSSSSSPPSYFRLEQFPSLSKRSTPFPPSLVPL